MKQYFYIDANNQQVGPINEDALMELVRCGDLSRQTPIWTEGLANWMPFGVVFPKGAGRIPQFSPKTAPDPNLSGTHTAEQTQERNIAKGKTRSYLIIGGAVALIAVLSCFVFEKADTFALISTLAERNEPYPSRFSKEEAVQELQKLGVIASELDIQGEVGRDAMFDAVRQGNTAILELLLAGGFNANQKYVYGFRDTPLSFAAARGNPEIVKLLLAVPGIDVNESAPLTSAAQNGHTEIVKLLLAAYGIDVNVNNDDEPPLWQAAGRGHTEIVKLLLAVPGIDVDRANKAERGSTPLSYAAYNGHTEIVKLLRAAGAHK